MAKINSLAESGHLTKVALYEKWAPDAYKAFGKFATAAFAEGSLSVREKEIIAVGCAHVLRCPYCIDHHIELSTKAGASEQELAESIWVAIAMGAGACFAHAGVAARKLKGEPGVFYPADGNSAVADFASLNPTNYGAYADFQHSVFAEGVLSAEFKQLVAIACAHNTRCPYCIEHHVGLALAADIEKNTISEAIWIAVEMGAGACFGHAGLAAAILE